jgi:ATP-dependent exoDNAse (exonuclease V) beta subunit
LLHRLAELGPNVLARELPVLLSGTDDGPVGFLAGSVDLVYRDPAGGGIVVVDFKTDRVEEGDRIASRAAAYRPQLETYARALQEALGLVAPPRKELWFLWPDEVVAWG